MYLDEIKNLKTYKNGKPQFNNSFKYWRNKLFEQVNKLFSWENLPFPQKEIESRLYLFGIVAIIKEDNELVAVKPNLFGITNYYDEFTDINFATPLISGERKIDIDCILIDNNTLRNPTINMIDRYAMILAHTEISLITALVNGRATKTYVATNNKVAENIRDYQKKLYEGQNDVIVDSSFIGLEIKDNDNSSLNNIKTLYDIRQNLLYSFLEEMGIKKNQQKKERLVTDEVNADDTFLKLNIKDMFEARKTACEKINNMFGTNWYVKCNVDYDGDGVVDKKGDSANEET